MLKLTILISLSVVFFIIGVHQTINYGFAKSYGVFMLMLVFFFTYLYYKGKNEDLNKENKIDK